jgi:hypothetical protein
MNPLTQFKNTTMLLGFAITTVMMAPAILTPAMADCEAPGTPNNEAVTSTASKTLIYSFDNTARRHPDSHPVRGNDAVDALNRIDMYFDINMKVAGTPDSQEWTYIENDGPHALGYLQRMTYTITREETRHINPANLRNEHVERPLQPNKTYCLRVWARLPGGCRSLLSSSWKCGKVMP